MEFKSLSSFFTTLYIILFFGVLFSEAEELTFELPDNEKMCFHEYAAENVKCNFEFQVITGGNYDVDVEITSHGLSLYKKQKSQYDSFQWVAAKAGDFKICFSNEFSTFTHKMVYFDLRMGDDEDGLHEALDEKDKHHTALTRMESSTTAIHDSLKSVIDYQTHHRLREAQGEEFAESLNERVSLWSVGQASVILLVGLGQILVLRSFFTDKR